MAKVENLLPFLNKWEGGYVNDPNDSGGRTNRGVTFTTYVIYCSYHKLKPSLEEFHRMPDALWKDIVKSMFWDKWRADEIQSQKIANMLVDWYWASGKWGIVLPQRLLKVNADGIVGNKTISAVNAAETNDLFNNLYQLRMDYFYNIIDASIKSYELRIKRKATEKELLTYTMKKYLKGWTNRLNDLR